MARADDGAELELRRLTKLAADPKADRAQLWKDLLTLQHTFPGTPAAQKAVRLQATLRSPLDALDPRAIAEADRRRDDPEEMVALLAPHRTWCPEWADHDQLQLSGDGKWVVKTGVRGRIWDAKTLQQVATVDSLFFNLTSDHRTIAITPRSRRDTIEIVRWHDGKLRFDTLQYKPKYIVWNMLLTRNGTRLLVWYQCDDGDAEERGETFHIVWDLTQVKPKPIAMFTTEETSRFPYPLPWSLSDDGSIFYQEVENDKAEVWDIRKLPAQHIATIQKPGQMTLSPDGRFLAQTYPGRDPLRLIDLSVKPAKELTCVMGSEWLSGVRFSPDCKRVIAFTDTDARPSLLEWTVKDLLKGAAEKKEVIPCQRVQLPCSGGRHAFSPDGKTLAMLTDKGILLWDCVNRKEISPPQEKPIGPARALCFGPDGTSLLSAGDDHQLRLWQLDGRTLKQVHVSDKYRNRIEGFSLAPWNNTLSATTDRSGKVPLWKLEANRVALLEGVESHPPTDKMSKVGYGDTYATLSPDGRLLATAEERRDKKENDRDRRTRFQTRLQLWDVSKKAPSLLAHFYGPYISVPLEKGGRYDLNNVCSSPTGTTLALHTTRTIFLFDVSKDTLTERGTIELPLGYIGGDLLRCVFTPDGRLAVTVLEAIENVGTKDEQSVYRLRFWDVSQAKPKEAGHWNVPDDLGELYFSPDGTLLLCWGEEKVLRDAATGKILHELTACDLTGKPAFAPDSRHLAVGREDGSIVILRLRPGPKN